MEPEIRNHRLTPADVPERFADLEDLEPFALSFDAYAHWGDRCRPNAETIAREFRESGRLPSDLDDLRACLFFEHQRWRWYGLAPDADAERYIQALLEAIREAADTAP